MKIALVIYQFSEARGGVERFCAEFTRGLVRRGHEVHLFAQKAEGVPDGAAHHPVPVRKWTSWMKHLSFAEGAERLLRERSFDLIQTFSRTTYQDVYRVGGGSHQSYLRSVGMVDGGWWSRLKQSVSLRDRAILRLERLGFRPGAYRKIVCVSNRCRGDLLSDFEIPAGDVEVIHNGIDLRRFHPENRERWRKMTRSQFGIPEDEPVFLFAGTGFRRKGLRHALEALATLAPGEKARLWVLGRGETGHYRRLAQKLRLKDRVYFLGPRDTIEPFYAAADAFLFPTLYDPFPNACLEALASGLPVVLSRCAGVSELMTHGVDGFILEDPRSAEEIGRAIRPLLDPATRERMGAAARRTAEKRSMETCVDEYLSLYGRVVKQKPGNGSRQAEGRRQ